MNQLNNRPMPLNGPMDQWTNVPMDQCTNRPIDRWTNGPMDKQTFDFNCIDTVYATQSDTCNIIERHECSKSQKVGCRWNLDIYQHIITIRAPFGANKYTIQNTKYSILKTKEKSKFISIVLLQGNFCRKFAHFWCKFPSGNWAAARNEEPNTRLLSAVYRYTVMVVVLGSDSRRERQRGRSQYWHVRIQPMDDRDDDKEKEVEDVVDNKEDDNDDDSNEKRLLNPLI